MSFLPPTAKTDSSSQRPWLQLRRPALLGSGARQLAAGHSLLGSGIAPPPLLHLDPTVLANVDLADGSSESSQTAPDDFQPGNFPFANPTSSRGAMRKDALDFDLTTGLSLVSGIPDPDHPGHYLFGGGLNTLQLSWRNQMWRPGFDLGLAVGGSYASQGGASAKNWGNSLYLSPTAHYDTSFGSSGWGYAQYVQGTGGFRGGASAAPNAKGFVGAQATSVFGYEPDGAKTTYDINFPYLSWNSVGQFNAGPNLRNPLTLGLQASVQRTFDDQHWSLLGEGYLYGERGFGLADSSGVVGPSVWGMKYGAGVGFAHNWRETDPLVTGEQINTFGLNFNWFRENLWASPSAAGPAARYNTNTFLLNLTLGYRKF